VKDENGDLLADSNKILNRWKNPFPQLLSVHNANDVGQIEIHIVEQLVPHPNPVEVSKLKRYKLPVNEQTNKLRGP
jgi:hypothetical protein